MPDNRDQASKRALPVVSSRLLLLLFSAVSSAEPGGGGALDQAGRQARLLSNPFGVAGHDWCSASLPGEEEKRGQCYNELECLATGGQIQGYCEAPVGSNILMRGACCVHVVQAGQTSRAGLSYLQNTEWPLTGNGSALSQFKILPAADTCFVRLDLMTLELAENEGNCVHDRLTVLGGLGMTGNMCGDRSGEVTLIEPTQRREPISVIVLTQSQQWRWNIGVQQISCSQVESSKNKFKEANSGCGVKNPSLNDIGSTSSTRRKKKPSLKLPKTKSASEVFQLLETLPQLTEFERESLEIFRPSFTKQTLDFSKINVPPLGRSSLKKGRILYGNETSVNEYPWQISMWIDKSHFCGGTLISDQWVVTAAHCVDLQYKNHFNRVTVSLGDHNVKVFDEADNVFRKISRIVRFPSYDQDFLDGDLALLHLSAPLTISSTISPACLPADPEETFGYSDAVITGWGYTEETKKLLPRPMTSDVLREADVYILPPDLCVKYSPFPITDKMICTFKGPLGVETTCQGDSGGPLVVNSAGSGDNKWTLVGATSFGVSTCEGPYPSMFARVTEFLDFIYASMVENPFEELAS